MKTAVCLSFEFAYRPFKAKSANSNVMGHSLSIYKQNKYITGTKVLQ